MPEDFETRQTWPFECLRCLHVWEEDFVVRHLSDAYGNGGDIWLSSGVPVPPPWSDACCPACGGYRVTWFPSGHPIRVPEPEHEPEHDEPETMPEPVPVRAPAPVPERTHLPGRLLVALGVPLALFVGYELFANAVASVRPHP
ncbi:hypothetical protein HCN51_06895 [Nonomuraea sp. FMUSA5-5]|uniref:Uncharacterized protein n=1 Tax=Nonomuraea composti TaxID=2720023 RepID=A0ABX1AU66_9ACTN|nr:hypothetical protein [Nonomuraea sp. FMUSA5-5]NJP89175.1 hypothetical protein [Nonomuraea sp. FMUSA5-5]